MTEHDALLQAILDDPDDDAPRLVYADWLEEHGDAERGEFIRAQLRFADPALKGPRRWSLRARIHALFLRHEAAWAGPVPALVLAYEFRRGFIEFVEMQAVDFPSHAELLFRSTPLRHLKPVHLPDALTALADCPALARLATLDLTSNYSGDWLGFRALAVLLASPHLAGLRGLLLENNSIGVAGAELLAGCPHLTGLSTLTLDYNHIGDAGLRALCSGPWLTSLTVLSLRANDLTAAGVQALVSAPTVLGLRILNLDDNRLGDEGVQTLAEAPQLVGLTELRLRSAGITDAGAQALVRSPHLRHLALLDLLGNPAVGEAARRALKTRFGKGGCQL
jgi:uncharacterized protein (TIGR02996 family)